MAMTAAAADSTCKEKEKSVGVVDAEHTKLHQIAESAIVKFRVSSNTYTVDPRHCLVDPVNRDGSWLNSNRVHELLTQIITAGFSMRKLSAGIVCDIGPCRLAQVLAHNKAMTEGDEKLPDVQASDPAFYTVLHTNHFVMICRCFYYRAKTTEANIKLGLTDGEGKLSLEALERVDKEFFDYLRSGHKVIRLNSELAAHPHLMAAIQSSGNLDLTMGETEAQLLVRAAKELWQDSITPPSAAVIGRVTKKLQGQMPHLHHYIDPVIKFASKYGSPGAPFLDDLMSFHSEHVNASKNRSEADFWLGLSQLQVDYGWPAVAFAKDNWSSDKVRGGICRGVAIQAINGFRSSSGQVRLRVLDEHLKEWRVQNAQKLCSIDARTQTRILGRFDVFSSRVCLLGKTQTMKSKEEGEIIWEMKSYADVSLVSSHDLATALGSPVPQMSSLVPATAGSSSGNTKKSSIAVIFDKHGQVQNLKATLEARGILPESRVQADKNISCPSGCGQITKNDQGVVVSIDEEEVNIKFTRAGVQSWDLGVFPLEALVVTQLPGNAQAIYMCFVLD
jgi:hypothetical protein